MTEPVFGLIFELIDDDPRAPTWGDFSIVGLVLPSEDANSVTFPLNTAVDINTGDSTVLADMGTGPLSLAIKRINSQLDDLQRSARAVVVRVAEGTDTDPEVKLNQTIAHIVGDPQSGTGLYALLAAPQAIGVTARLLCCNGFTGINRMAVTAPHIDTPGSGYTTTPTVVFTPPGATGVAERTGTAVTGINLTHPGNYPKGTVVTVAFTGGGGTGASASVSMELLNNPICAALPEICEALMAHAIVGGPGETRQDAVDWQDLLNSKRLIAVDCWEIIEFGASTQYVDGAASVIGLGVRVDFNHAGFPFWSFANQPVQGLLGLKRIDSFSLIDGATDAQELLADKVGVHVKGNRSDVSLTDSGFQHISFNNSGSDTQWNLYNKTRGRDFIHLALMKSLRQRLGVDNITLHSVQAVLNDMAVIAAILKNQECVIGWHVGFRASDNNVLELRQGHFTVYFNAEQPAPILVITIKSGLDLRALDAELAALATELSDITQQPGQGLGNFF